MADNVADAITQLRYYPNEKYIRNNLAPEQIDADIVRELAWALNEAEQAQLLKPVVNDNALPNALVEQDDAYALDPGGTDFRQRDSALKDVFNLQVNNAGELPYRPMQQIEDFYAGSTYASKLPMDDSKRAHTLNQTIYDTQRAVPPAGAYVTTLDSFANKYPGELAIERWNGQGPGARNHVAKVLEMRRMLQHPQNKELVDYFNLFREPAAPEYP